MPDVSEYEKLKKKAERLRQEADRAAGARDAALKTLKDEFGCDSIEAAAAMLEKLKSEEARVAAEFEQEFSDFKAKWGEKLESIT
jgi:hypothetical protein